MPAQTPTYSIDIVEHLLRTNGTVHAYSYLLKLGVKDWQATQIVTNFIRNYGVIRQEEKP